MAATRKAIRVATGKSGNSSLSHRAVGNLLCAVYCKDFACRQARGVYLFPILISYEKVFKISLFVFFAFIVVSHRFGIYVAPSA